MNLTNEENQTILENLLKDAAVNLQKIEKNTNAGRILNNLFAARIGCLIENKRSAFTNKRDFARWKRDELIGIMGHSIVRNHDFLLCCRF